MHYDKGTFKYGFVVGRFQHLHIGHQKLIDSGLEITDKLLVFVDLANQPVGQKNPYTYEYRKSLIETVYKDEIENGKLVVAPLNDYNSQIALTPKWGDYVLENAQNIFGEKPKVIIYGKDKNIFKCFSKAAVVDLTELVIDRNTLDISATKMRSFLKEDDRVDWEKYADKRIHGKYDELKKLLDEATDNTL